MNSNLVSCKSILKCLEYSEEKEKLSSIINNSLNEKSFSCLAFNMGNDKDYNIIIKRNLTKEISFIFHQSINFQKTMKGGTIKEQSKEHTSFLYSILCCIKQDAYIPDSFTEFCDEFGYNPDSIKAITLFNDCKEQQKKILSIFTLDELTSFPD